MPLEVEEETLRRHATKPIADEVSHDELRSWYAERDLLGAPVREHVVPAHSSLPDTVELILRHSGLLSV
ncbi:hypothetical protein [Streptomyces sp. NPDC001530]|uniref:hypothetical protein n=1 Tax=Streptomyces sp. NPDC001530 TaxID=3364582 RepID=UPI0036B685F6